MSSPIKKTPLFYGVIGAAAGGLAVWFIMVNAVKQSNFPMMEMIGLRSQNTSTANIGMMGQIDAHFIEQMIPHHEVAITMAKLSPENATHQEIKTLSQNIIESQSREISQMKAWYKDWYGKELPTGTEVMSQQGMTGSSGMHMGMMGSDDDLDSLKNAPDFDKEFIQQMIPHHQTAVMMANMLKNGTTRPEMKKLADDIITAQTKEINEMRNWYASWYK